MIRRPAYLPGWIATALTSRPGLTPSSAPDRRNASAYTLAALNGELDKVLAATPGQRNDTLNRAAEDLVGSWTLVDDDWRLVGNKAGPTRLGFALLLKFL